MIKEKIPDLNNLSKDEKLRLAGELWNEAFDEEDIELTEAQKEELESRIKYAEEHPEEMIPWEEVRDELKKSMTFKVTFLEKLKRILEILLDGTSNIKRVLAENF